MPFLDKKQVQFSDGQPQAIPLSGRTEDSRRGSALFPVCSNADCKAGRLRLWRSCQTPVLEGGWLCSPECTRARLREMLAREMEGRSEVPVVHQHRVPLGLVMLAQGWITQAQLRNAIEAQRQGNQKRLGDLLVELHGLDQRLVTRALGIQWNCPIFSLDGFQPALVSSLVPRLLLDSFGFVPVRATVSSRLHIGFEGHLDPCVTFAIERMTGCRVEAGLLSGSDFRLAHPQMLAAAFPKTRLMEAAGLEPLVHALSLVLEDSRAVEARLVRVHDFFWLRIWRVASGQTVPRREDVEDVICSLMQAN